MGGEVCDRAYSLKDRESSVLVSSAEVLEFMCEADGSPCEAPPVPGAVQKGPKWHQQKRNGQHWRIPRHEQVQNQNLQGLKLIGPARKTVY